ncbi:hypothetical protein SAMN04515648_1009 [Phyllobacterium sp. CL33Tsu]|uniref:hypothetical protein n=1 Tax=Phyllobacterium sp. CL33Tsu TaxID=1798191 RepID=UPI0008EAC35D|nr:hypothetical protein [Phyllobacterium sp. CL33Tsu]SFI65528.1 hypothetical protein SAMN04515648_1009 [Phyllobacterium sp. CL33Tsu]
MKFFGIFRSWLSLGISLTVIYIGWLTHIIATRTGNCSSDAIGLTCLDLNGLGDFFAGVFAPLAFIWLVVAVLIQSSELKSQREELKLTRQEMEQSREVLKAQTEEARKQAEFIGLQTKLMQQKVADDAFLRSLASLSHWVSHNFQNQHIDIVTNGNQNRILLRVTKSSDQGVLTDICRTLVSVQHSISPTTQQQVIPSFGKEPIDQLRDRLETLLEFADEVSPAIITLIAETQLKKGIAAAQTILPLM